MKVIIKCPFCNRQILKSFSKHLKQHYIESKPKIEKEFIFKIDIFRAGWLFIEIEKLGEIDKFQSELLSFKELLNNKKEKIQDSEQAKKIKQNNKEKKRKLEAEKKSYNLQIREENERFKDRLFSIETKAIKISKKNIENTINGSNKSIFPIYHNNGEKK